MYKLSLINLLKLKRINISSYNLNKKMLETFFRKIFQDPVASNKLRSSTVIDVSLASSSMDEAITLCPL